jgi:hypothetical protein
LLGAAKRNDSLLTKSVMQTLSAPRQMEIRRTVVGSDNDLGCRDGL